MDHRRRRLPLIIGATLLAIAVVAPTTVSAASQTITTGVRGSHVWAGELCDGTDVSVAFHVTRRGRVVLDDVDGARARTARIWHGFRVRFVGTQTRVWVWTSWRRGNLRLHIVDRKGTCPTPPPEEPTDPPPTDDGGNGQSG